MIRATVAGLAMLAGMTSLASAQQYPDRPIQMIVPFGAGGAVDYVARVVAQHLKDKLGQPVIVENRPGASGNIGTYAVATAKPDGYTLLVETVTNRSLIDALKKDKANINLKSDLKLVAPVGLVPFVVVINSAIPATKYSELKDAQAKLNKPLTFASTGVGSTEHLATEMLKAQSKLSITHVPYTGGALAIADVVGGHVSGMIATLPTALPHIASGKIKPLFITVPKRLPQLPDVPTSAEAGLPNFEVASLYGILAPGKLSDAIGMRLNAAITEVVQSSEFKQAMEQRGIIPMTASLEESAKMFINEVDKWNKVVKDENIQVD